MPGKTGRMKPGQLIAFLVIFLIGLALFLVPYAYCWLHHRSEEKAIDSFISSYHSLPEPEKAVGGKADQSAPQESEGSGETHAAAELPELSALREAMEAYNRKLSVTGQSALSDQNDFTEPDFNPADYGAESDILGYISIEAIGIRLPVYNGASEENMAKGAVLLAYTSLPIGGESTNSVIAAHTRYKGVDMFRDITALKAGDIIEVTNYFETLRYAVCETKVIDPDDCGEIYIQPGRDLLTLSTCHPFPDNYQRYLVFAERLS